MLLILLDSMLAGGHNPMSFPWFHSPSKEQILGAFDTLFYYDLIQYEQATDGSKLARITQRGREIDSFGIDILAGEIVHETWSSGSEAAKEIVLTIANMVGKEEQLFKKSFLGDRPATFPAWLKTATPNGGDLQLYGQIVDAFPPTMGEKFLCRISSPRIRNRLPRQTAPKGQQTSIHTPRQPLDLQSLLVKSMSQNLALHEGKGRYFTVEDVEANLSCQSGSCTLQFCSVLTAVYRIKRSTR
jgi:HrpA-like RNA helicase